MKLAGAVTIAASLLMTSCDAGAVPQTNAVPPVSLQPSPASKMVSTGDAPASTHDSVYSSLAEKECKKLKPLPDEDGVLYKAECKGTGGYRLIHYASDHSQALTVVDTAGKEANLGFRAALKNSAADFAIGNTVEWRIARADKKPVALIIRLNQFPDREDLNKVNSYLTVISLAPDATCVTDVVEASAQQNEKARSLADTARSRPCIKEDQ